MDAILRKCLACGESFTAIGRRFLQLHYLRPALASALHHCPDLPRGLAHHLVMEVGLARHGRPLYIAPKLPHGIGRRT
jgi:hypothetical protein